VTVSRAEGGEARIPKLEIKLLGRFEVLRDGEPIPEEAWGRQKTKTLLKVLLTNPGHVFTQDQLIDALFSGEDIEKARKNLYGRVSRLRRVLEPDLKHGTGSSFIHRTAQGYSFCPQADVQIDAATFRHEMDAALALAGKKQWMEAAEKFEDAVAIYGGELLPEDRYEDWAEERRSDLKRDYIHSMLQLATCFEHLGRLRQSISCCQRVLALEPHREDIFRRVMEYQSEAGQREQALATYREGERAVREYLGVELSAETRALRNKIVSLRDQEPRLDPRRIAVLPLQNYSPDPADEYLAEGMTEELTGCLSQIRDFRVLARTSVLRFRDSTEPVSAIARELAAGTILEGSIRKA
jgi:DNA-binding SARP family transcriptional activator